MINNILVGVAFFCVSTIYGQYDWTEAKVILKKGTSFKGLVKLPRHSGQILLANSTDFKYKKIKNHQPKDMGEQLYLK